MDDIQKHNLKLRIIATAKQLGFNSAKQAIRDEFEYINRCRYEDPILYHKMLENLGGEQKLAEVTKFLKEEFFDKDEKDFI